MRPVSEGSAEEGDAETGRRQRRKRSFPPPVVILTVLLVLVWIAAFFIPSGQYALDAAGSPIAGSFRFVPAPLDFGGRVRDLLLAPINGMYGVRDLETGMVGPSNRGKLFGSVEVFLFILSIGGFMSVVFATGALERGIHHLSYRFRERGALLVAILTLLFCVLGSIKGWSDESLGLYAIMVPLMIALGYDRLVTVAVITVAPFVGAAAATINPFNIGIAASKAGVSIADRLGLRFTLLVLSVAATVAYTLWYARRVKADPAKSLCGIGADEAALAEADSRPPEPLTSTHAIVIALVAFTFALLIFAIIPWGAILDNAAVDPDTETTIRSPLWWELGWWLPELTALFFVMTIAVGMVGSPRSGGTRQSLRQGGGRVRRSGLSRDACAQRLGGHDEHQDDRHGASRHGGPGRRRLQRQVHPPDVLREPTTFVRRRRRVGGYGAHRAGARAARRLRGHRPGARDHDMGCVRGLAQARPAHERHLGRRPRARRSRLRPVPPLRSAPDGHSPRGHPYGSDGRCASLRSG